MYHVMELFMRIGPSIGLGKGEGGEGGEGGGRKGGFKKVVLDSVLLVITLDNSIFVIPYLWFLILFFLLFLWFFLGLLELVLSGS